MLSITKLLNVTKSIIHPRIAASCQIHSSNPLSSSLEEKLGLPAKPKKALTPFFRFLADNREKFAKENPNMKQPELIQLLAKKYAEIDPAILSKYKEEFMKDQENYIKKRSIYESKLTEDQKMEIANAKQEAEERKSKIEHKKKLRENEKPKKPPSAFLRYLIDMSTKHPRDPNQSYKEHLVAMGELWKKLPEAQKKVYIDAAHNDIVKFKQELSKWELKMIRLGNVDLVREKTVIEDTKPTRARLYKQKPRSVSSDSD